jgi:adenylate cyclase
VIARHSALAFKGRTAKVQDVSRELGVRYVLEGSIRRAADRLRITVQLADAVTGRNVWADRYDREMRDIFELQDEITRHVVTELQVQLTQGEQARVWRRATADLEAYDAVLRGRERFFLLRREDNQLAREFLQKAVDRDARFAHAVVLLGATHLADAWFGWSATSAQSTARAEQLATRGLELDEFNADAYALLGMIQVLRGSYGEAIAHGEKAVSLSPSGADVAAYHADILNRSGRAEDGLMMIRRAMRLSPTHPPYYLGVLGHACWQAGRYEDALATFRRSAALEPTNPRPRIALAALFVLTGRMSEARAAADEVRRLHPKFSVERWARQSPYRNPDDLEQALTALRQAGLE